MLSCMSRGNFKKMNKKIKKMDEKKFRRIMGVKKDTFKYLLMLLKTSNKKKNLKVGRSEKLSSYKQLMLTLQYWSNYMTLLEVGTMFGVSEATSCRIVKKIEDELAKSGVCKLSGKKSFLTTDEEQIIVDVTECAIERPKRKKLGRIKNRQKYYYSGKKKRHTIKAQLLISNKEIRATAFANGKKHDFRLFKESKTYLHKSKKIQADSGYQGLQKLHSESDLPKKGSKKNPLTKEDKAKNKQQAKKRVVVEHVIGWIKRFKIISTRYRGRRKRFALRFNLICGIYNYENKGGNNEIRS